MKRSKSAQPQTGRSLQLVAEAKLAHLKGGATAIEYGLVLPVSPTPTN